MVKTIIVDDDSDNRFILSSFLKDHFPGIFLAGEAGSVRDALYLVKQKKPNLLLLDIALPDGNGLEMLQQLTEREFEVIFVTAYNEYAVQAFRLSAIDYLLKPFTFTALSEAMQKALDKIQQNLLNQNLNTLLFNLRHTSGYEKKLAITTGNGFQFTEIKNIIWLESNSNYTNFHCAGGVKIMSSRTMGYYEALLPADRFCRIHHSYIVNITFVERFIRTDGSGTVLLTSGEELSVSQRRKDAFLKMITGN